ncbi:MAG: S8 family serine peptidase [Granulosicoccus sp.]
MIEKRQTALDSGLNELIDASDEADLLISESTQILATPTGFDLERPPARRGLGQRPASSLPSEKLTVKLITAVGALDAVAAQASDMGCDIVSSGPQVILANVPRSALQKLASMPGLKRAEESRRLQLSLDLARGEATRADALQAMHPDLRGDSVVVGIVDTGADWSHEDFCHDNGSSRLTMFLHAVHDQQSGTDSFDEFSTEQINAALSGEADVPAGDINGHGTHCLSIAAGNGNASEDRRYRGLATNAELMAVRSDSLHDTHIIEGIRRIFDRAGDKPAVINLSLGGHMGPHDGTSALENVIARETGPGRIVVVAAGNEGADRIHYQGQLETGQNLDIEFTIRDDLQILDIWVPRGDEADISIIDAHGLETIPDGSVQQTEAGAFRADLREDQFNGDVNLQVVIAARQMGRRWRIRLAATHVVQGDVHAWGRTSNNNFSRNIFMSENSPRYSIGMPATEERAISVGSFVSRADITPNAPGPAGLMPGQLSPFSSHGPARHGAQRPDVAAPGQHIIAALAAGSDMASRPELASRRLEGERYISIQGTSMATPFVTGVIALMLQKEPNLAPDDIQLRLRATARRDGDTGAVWNPGFGYGKIDVEALLNYTGLA